MKSDAPFYIGTTNIYDYQATGFKRWNTWRAAAAELFARATRNMR